MIKFTIDPIEYGVIEGRHCIGDGGELLYWNYGLSEWCSYDDDYHFDVVGCIKCSHEYLAAMRKHKLERFSG